MGALAGAGINPFKNAGRSISSWRKRRTTGTPPHARQFGNLARRAPQAEGAQGQAGRRGCAGCCERGAGRGFTAYTRMGT